MVSYYHPWLWVLPDIYGNMSEHLPDFEALNKLRGADADAARAEAEAAKAVRPADSRHVALEAAVDAIGRRSKMPERAVPEPASVADDRPPETSPAAQRFMAERRRRHADLPERPDLDAKIKAKEKAAAAARQRRVDVKPLRATRKRTRRQRQHTAAVKDAKPSVTPKERNEAARKRADTDPNVVLDHVADIGWPMLSEALNRWNWKGLLPSDEPGQPMAEQGSRSSIATAAYRAAETAQTPEWRAIEIWNLVYMKRQGKQIPNHMTQALIEHLTAMTEMPDRMSGLTLLTAIVEALPVPAQWDNRRHTNLPAPLTDTRHIVSARKLNNDGQPALLTDWDAPAPRDGPRFEVGYLPTLAPSSSLLPLALLDVFSAAASRGRGGPVPVAARIGWEVLVALGGEDRERIGGPAVLDCKLKDLFSMVYPSTPRWQDSKGANLLRGLFNLDAARVRWRGDAEGGLYPLVEVYRMPTRAHPAEPIAFLSHLPPGSRQGALVDRWLLRELAAVSARQHRMMLTAYCLFDRYGTVNGRLIAPTVPKVHRDSAGYVVDTRGRLLTEHGAPTRRPTHRRAVQTGARVRNTEVDHYPWLEGHDLILTGYPVVGTTPAKRRDQRRRITEAATALRDAGHLDFETTYQSVRGGHELVALRLLPDAKHVKAHTARWAARNRGGR